MYSSSVAALAALDQQSIDELRSYRVPPDAVQSVMSAVCLLFDVPMSSYVAAGLRVTVCKHAVCCNYVSTESSTVLCWI